MTQMDWPRSIQRLKKDLMKLAPGQITLSTIFYGGDVANPEAPGIMQGMATTGGGQFLDTDTNPTGKDFQISDIVTIPGVTCTATGN